MFKFVVVFAASLAVVAAGIGYPAALAVGPAPFAYTNAPLYAAGGSQQIDVRHNYDGTLSSYTTTPFGYTSPISSRYVAGAPAVAGPVSFAAPAAFAAPAGALAPYSVPYIAGFNAPWASSFAAVPAKVVV